MIIKAVCLFQLCLLSILLNGQTPEQTYFEWATMPFSTEELAQRRDNLANTLQRQGKSGFVLIPSKDGFSHGDTFRQLDDFYYLTGLELPNSILVLDVAVPSAIIYTPERDARFENGSRKNDFPGRPLASDSDISVGAGIKIKDIRYFPGLIDSIVRSNLTVFINSGRPGPVINMTPEYITSYSPNQILINGLQTKHIGVKFENIYASLAITRMIKSPNEIAKLQRAVDITVDGIIAAAQSIHSGISERFLEGVLEGSFKKNASARLAFGSIIKSGPNSLWPWRILATHYDRRNRKMKDGELVIFDVGAEYDYYVSDVGRTFPVSGRFSTRQKEILEMETGIADQIIEFIQPGITFNDVRKLTDRIIPKDAKKYMQVGLYFGHHLGLSTGDPNLPNATLQPGMVFTVEPWYYNHDEDISVFTEDVILVTKDGCVNLSKRLPRTPVGLENLMKD